MRKNSIATGILTAVGLAFGALPAAAQDGAGDEINVNSLYAMASVAGARPNCTTRDGLEATAQTGEANDAWLHRQAGQDSWSVVRIVDGEETMTAVGDDGDAVSLFIVCGMPAFSDEDLVRLSNEIRDAADRQGDTVRE